MTRFTATVSGSSDTGVSWTASGGTIDAMGVYTAPDTLDTFEIVATSNAEPSARGTATVVVRTPRSCSELPEPGIWENISPAGATETDAVVIDPFDSATVWMGGRGIGIQKSTDCGATWTHVNVGRNGTEVDNGAPGSMAVDPVNEGVMYTTAFMGSNGLWKSTNGGVDWDQLFPEGSEVFEVVQYNLTNSIAMDPNDPTHLIASMHAKCGAPYLPVCLAETKDAGATWRIVNVDCGASDWVAGAGAFILSENDWLFGSYSNGLWLTRDGGASWDNITPEGASGATGGKTLILPFYPSGQGLYYLAAMEGILRSSDGFAWSLIPNSGGRSVGLAMGDGRLFSSDQWSAVYRTALESDASNWSTIAPPEGLPSDQGAPYLAYDTERHLLYSSNWNGGLWRVVAP
jgi:hypothetical protein